MSTIAELIQLRDEMIERRRIGAYSIQGAHNDDPIKLLANVHIAIAAIDAVISEGKDLHSPAQP